MCQNLGLLFTVHVYSARAIIIIRILILQKIVVKLKVCLSRAKSTTDK